MNPLFHYAGTFVLSLLLALYLTPVIRAGAVRFGVLDHPDGKLKRQKEPTPYLGGIAVYLAFTVTLGLIFDFRPQLLGLLLGGTLVTMVGLFDDLKVLPPRLKLAGQLLAALALMKSGVYVQLEWVPWVLALALSLFWLVGTTNALNILDVSDGLATGVAAIASLALFGVAVQNGDVLIATTTLALGGSLFGFLWFNRSPAKIYLGDTGSLFIGFMLASLAMIGRYTEVSTAAAIAPVVILWVPLFELAFVSVVRISKGLSPMQGSPDHFAIRLKQRGFSAGRIAAMAWGAGVVCGALGLVMVTLPANQVWALAGGLGLVSSVVALWLVKRPA